MSCSVLPVFSYSLPLVLLVFWVIPLAAAWHVFTISHLWHRLGLGIDLSIKIQAGMSADPCYVGCYFFSIQCSCNFPALDHGPRTFCALHSWCCQNLDCALLITENQECRAIVILGSPEDLFKGIPYSFKFTKKACA